MTSVGMCGCWPFHHKQDTPQQQFMNALNRGNGAEASQIWLQMSPDDRVKFSRSEGMAPQSSPDEIKKRVMEHYAGPADAREGQETIEQVTPEIGHGGLESLPEYVGPASSSGDSK
ncbi:MAG TPA: hypothetical protein VIX12_07720 [Candidatus Binataceae bacterium]